MRSVAPDVSVDVERLVPGLAAVGRHEDAAFRIRPEEMAHRRDPDDVRVLRMDDDAADGLRFGEADVLELHLIGRRQRVGALVDAVAERAALAVVRLRRCRRRGRSDSTARARGRRSCRCRTCRRSSRTSCRCSSSARGRSRRSRCRTWTGSSRRRRSRRCGRPGRSGRSSRQRKPCKRGIGRHVDHRARGAARRRRLARDDVGDERIAAEATRPAPSRVHARFSREGTVRMAMSP